MQTRHKGKAHGSVVGLRVKDGALWQPFPGALHNVVHQDLQAAKAGQVNVLLVRGAAVAFLIAYPSKFHQHFAWQFGELRPLVGGALKPQNVDALHVTVLVALGHHHDMTAAIHHLCQRETLG